MSASILNSLQAIEVLLIDDDEADVLLTLRALKNDRVLNNIHVVRDGVEAMNFLRRQGPFADAPRPDIIFLDLNMPRMDGREVLQAIKSDKKLATIPVIVLTVSAAEEDIVRSYDLGCSSFIIKPVDFEQFVKTIRGLGHYWFELVALPWERGI